MSDKEDLGNKGREMLQDVALRYASQHGLRPERVEWENPYGEEWWMKVSDQQHAVKVVFSMDEIVDFAEGGSGAKSSKVKIRNAFAGLAM